MTTHVTHLIKTFPGLSISLKIQAEVFKAACKSEHDRVACQLSECLLGALPRGPCAPGRLASLLGFQHSVTLPPGYLHLSLPPRTVSSPTEDEFYIPPKKYMKVTAVISSLK